MSEKPDPRRSTRPGGFETESAGLKTPFASPTDRKVDHGRRSLLSTAATALTATSIGIHSPAVIGQSRPFSGITLNVSCWSANYPRMLADYVPEFTQLTGAKVNYDTPGFPVFNQRADLELSTKGSGFDVLNLTFIFANRWIGNGWFTPLDPFINDAGKTSPDFDFSDFLAGAVAPMRDTRGSVHAIPWVTDAQLTIATRFDLLQAEGLGMPDTFDELEQAAKTVHRKDGVDGFLTDNHWGLWYPPLLQGYGGNVFRAPPDDLMPMLDTPEAIQAAEQLARIVSRYGPAGAGGMAYGQSGEVLKSARANLSVVTHAGGMSYAEAGNKAASTIRFSGTPRGPKGRFPSIASHGWGIPAGSRNKDAAWAFIQWAQSKQLLLRMVREKQLGSITRASIFNAPEYRKLIEVNGVDTGKLVLDTIKLGEQGHMKYRTVPVYPQVNVQINQAIGRIISGEMNARESMARAQSAVLSDLKRAGVRV